MKNTYLASKVRSERLDFFYSTLEAQNTFEHFFNLVLYWKGPLLRVLYDVRD